MSTDAIYDAPAHRFHKILLASLQDDENPRLGDDIAFNGNTKPAVGPVLLR